MPLEIVRLVDSSVSSEVRIAPTRGGMVTGFDIAGRPILYLDEDTLLDETKNVRGGVPVLFPSPGAMAKDHFAYGTKTGAMPQHGFARNRPWKVTKRSDVAVTLVLRSDEITRAQFPWDFELTYRYSLEKTRLRIDQRFENRSDSPMPFAAGFHPYFFVRDADKPRASVPTSAAHGWDNVSKREVSIAHPIDLGADEVDLHLYDHGRSSATLDLGDGRPIVVSGSPEFERWVVWTLARKNFVCLEPWTAGANALNDRKNLLVVEPRAAKALWVEIAVD